MNRPVDFTNAMLTVLHDLGMMRDDVDAETLATFEEALGVLLRAHQIRLPPLVQLERRKQK